MSTTDCKGFWLGVDVGQDELVVAAAPEGVEPTGWRELRTRSFAHSDEGLDQLVATVAATLNYTWTRAIIDQENEGGGAYNGKDLPGVPRHGVVLGLVWQASSATSLGLTHTWRSSAYAAEDFANESSQKQAAYQSTDLALRYRLKNLEWFAAVEICLRNPTASGFVTT